jgi:putative membrane protein
MCRTAALAAALLLTFPPPAWAGGASARPGAWWQAWNWDPLVLLSLGVLAWLYGRGLMRLWGKVGVGCKLARWQAASYFSALGTIFFALLSPVDALSEELSSLHMVQHMLLTMAAAPLFVLGSPALVLAWGLPEWSRGWGSSWFTFVFRLPQTPILWQPFLVWTLFSVTLWTWHHPLPYQAALRDPLVHDAQHLSFFLTACLFWRACLDPLSRRRLCPALAIPYLFATSLHASALGVFLALSPQAWYDDYATRTGVWGFTPLEDQQLAGFIMWAPSCLVFPAVAAVLFGTWLMQLGAQERRPLASRVVHTWR